VIISTPQDLSLIDARRGLAMFKKVNVPVLGIVENMSYFQCPQCGTRSDIFGHGGARQEARTAGRAVFGRNPAAHVDSRHVGLGNTGGGQRAGWTARGDLPRDRRQGPRSAPGRDCRRLSHMRLSLISAVMPLSRIPQANFRVKDRPPERPRRRQLRRHRGMLQEIWEKRPNKEMPE